VRVSNRISSVVPSPPRSDAVSKGYAIFRSGGGDYGDSLIPKDQHPVIVAFSSRLEVLRHLVAINISLEQGL